MGYSIGLFVHKVYQILLWKRGAELKTPLEEGVQGFLECESSDHKQHVRRSKVILDAPQDLDSGVLGDEGRNMEHFNVDREAHKMFFFLRWWTCF
jgi:hypothetical protein